MSAKGSKNNSSKTNALRMLDAEGVDHKFYDCDLKDNFTSGSDLARMLGQDPERVFKTLVTETPKGEHYVCVIPVDETLDMKKAAKALGEKKLEMLPLKKLLPLTGYIHGGCSPIGMKKPFKTVIDETAQLFEAIYVSGGRPGLQIEIAPETLAAIINAEFADLTV
ncbi:MAG: Cys-tRNA(Pro) deacylase [Anaerovoracaceae bacterium]|nr:Cys-tRNA(Pro) deacylase [Bacillota bacterium]MDD7733893.1 Cys-tRNA(Pro) deacylase [Bacillota bacterium]MDY5905736.1 Cys-tRNA(Pro) deacylase [Anaerovoracaceae bacterium]